MSPINTTTHYLLIAILGVLIGIAMEGWGLFGSILVVYGAGTALWRIIVADIKWWIQEFRSR